MPITLERPVPGGDGDGDRAAAEAEFLAHGIEVGGGEVGLRGFERYLQVRQAKLLTEWERSQG